MKQLVLLLMTLVSASVLAQHTGCSVSVPAIHLGTYAGTAATSGVTPISVTCPAGSTYSVSLRSSTAGSGNRLRTMNGPRGARLNYQMFQDAAHTMNWGSEVGTDAVTGTGTGSAQRYNIYPAMAPAQQAVQGNYSDNVIVSVISNRGTYSTTVPVVANATTVCFLLSTNMVFGNYSSALVNATSTISVNCLAATPFDIALNAGTTTGATTSSRKMVGPNGGTLNYSLFRDAQRTQNWGNSTGTDTLQGTSSGLLQSITVYGQIPARQTPPSGSYTDTITATITY